MLPRRTLSLARAAGALRPRVLPPPERPGLRADDGPRAHAARGSRRGPRLRLRGNKLEGVQPPPHELDMHTEIYRRRPDVQSVVHSHPHMATALSTTGKTIYALNHQTRRYGKGIPLFKGDFITDARLGAELAECLGDQPAVLMQGHGAVLVGVHVADAVANTIYLEQAAKQQVWASAVGTPQVLPDRLLVDRFGEAGGPPLQNNLWRQLVWEWDTEQRQR